jgi:hypothetical protein
MEYLIMAKRPKQSARTFIGSSRAVSSEEKAMLHSVTGAGRSRVRRPFFTLGERRARAVRDGLEQLIARRLGADRS